MTRKLISTIKHEETLGTFAKVYRNPEWETFEVVYFEEGKREGDYETSCIRDAMDTAKAMVYGLQSV